MLCGQRFSGRIGPAPQPPRKPGWFPLEQTMSHTIPGSVPFSAGGLGLHPSRRAHITSLAGKLSSTIGLWSARSRQRRALGDLAELNSHLLKDIGVTPNEAFREAGKWFWQSDRLA
jgi:uncharacterized protein YjiS (DUF1127 family)